MTSAQITNAIRTAAKTVNPNGSFIPGRFSDGSLNFNAPGDQIHCDYPRRSGSRVNAPTKVYSYQMLFLRQDTQANLPRPEFDNTLNPEAYEEGAATQDLDSRMVLMCEMMDLIERFEAELDNIKGLSLLDGASDEPRIMVGAGGYSGYLTTFRVSTSNGYCNV